MRGETLVDIAYWTPILYLSGFGRIKLGWAAYLDMWPEAQSDQERESLDAALAFGWEQVGVG